MDSIIQSAFERTFNKPEKKKKEKEKSEEGWESPEKKTVKKEESWLPINQEEKKDKPEGWGKIKDTTPQASQPSKIPTAEISPSKPEPPQPQSASASNMDDWEVVKESDDKSWDKWGNSWDNDKEPEEPQWTQPLGNKPEEKSEKEKEELELLAAKANIVVVGSGCAGSNTISRLSDMSIEGAITVATDADARHLSITNADEKLLIGKDLTKGLGCGGDPELGRKAAEESKNELKKFLKDADLVFITCGLGGGTGGGSVPVIAEIAKDNDAIVIATVTLPFKIEGARIAKAEDSLYQLRQMCDTVIVIENQKLLKYAGDLSLKQAFAVADELISTTIKGLTETIATPSLVNLDFADVKTIMQTGGVSTVGIGEANTSERAKEAVMKALNHPLLEVNYSGATGALIQIVGGEDLKLDEVNEIGEFISSKLAPEATIMWGARVDPEYEGKIQVISIVTGVKSPYILGKLAKEPSEKGISDELGIEVIK